MSSANNPRIKVLGSGCERCQALEKNTLAALKLLGWDEPVGHVTDYAQIAAYGVMSTPALVLDGRVLSSGKLLSPAAIAALLRQNNAD